MHLLKEVNPKRDITLDILKFVAVILITNSHFRSLYQDISPKLATGGVIGDALFFFTAGFAMNLGKSALNGFVEFIHNKFRRLYPTFIAYAVLSSFALGVSVTWYDIVGFGPYWFIQCIMIYYIICYPLLKNKRLFNIYLVSSIVIMILATILISKADCSIYNNIVCRYFLFLIPFIFGIKLGNTSLSSNAANQLNYKYLIIAIISFILYFVVVSFGKGKYNLLYYTEILAMIPIILFLVYSYKGLNSIPVIKFVKCNKVVKSIVYIASQLTLQIYIVQFPIVEFHYEIKFPLNIFFVIGLILISAYVLKVSTSFLEQTLGKNPWNFKEMIKI